MKATRRRTRTPDPLASRAAINNVIKQLRAALPEVIPKSDKELLSMLRAIIHTERRPEIKTRRGRKSPWKDYQLVKAASTLRGIIERGTKGVSLRSFVEHYLLIPSFPEDVAQALDSGEINLFEAEQLARLTHSRTGIPEEKMKKRRREMLRTHLQLGESGARLKARVDALLYYYRHPEAIFQPAPETPQYSPEILAAAKQLEAEIESLDDASESSIAGISPDHFFYEYLQLITSYIPEIRPDEMSDAEMDRLMTLAEQLIHLLHTIHKRQNAPADEKTMEETKKAFHM